MILLFIIFLIAQFAPLILFFVKYKEANKISSIKIIVIYALISLIYDFLLGFFGNHNLFLNNSYIIFEYIILSSFFYTCIEKYKFRLSLILISILSITIEIAILFTHKASFEFWATLNSTILILIFSTIYFYEQINSYQPDFIYNVSAFWIVVGIIIYFSGTLFLFLYTAGLNDKIPNYINVVNGIFEIVKDICFSIAIVIAKDNKQKNKSFNFKDTNTLENPF